MPLQDTFWNRKYAVCTEKYSMTWKRDYVQFKYQPYGEYLV
ncbi:hypothetical protein [Bacillus wiedmannii]|nr:hypothetical protein [Bacillus wiedmannii]